MREGGVGGIDGKAVVEAVIGDIAGESAGQGSLGGAGEGLDIGEGGRSIDVKQSICSSDSTGSQGQSGSKNVTVGIDLEKIAATDDEEFTGSGVADADVAASEEGNFFGQTGVTAGGCLDAEVLAIENIDLRISGTAEGENSG